MASVGEHYDRHLAPYYDWVFGGRERKIEENRAFFVACGITDGVGKKALDLGCGSGFQAIPLAENGYAVTGVDISVELLQQLRDSGHERVALVHSDIGEFLQHNCEQYDVCVCMGDTLPHVAGVDDVESVLHGVYRSLNDQGVFIASLRDYSTSLEGTKRFIPVRQSDDTIWTCFLEYREQHVDVYDILYRRVNGKWEMTTSMYTKIRIAVEWLEQKLRACGFQNIEVEQSLGMAIFRAEKLSAADTAV